MDLAAFMEQVAARPTDVARETGLHASTVIRVRDGAQVPDGPTLLLLSDWAERERKRKRLPVAKRLTWQHLLPDGAAA